MPRQPSIRLKRVEDRMQAVIGDLLISRVNDPRLELVTVTRVKVDRELEFANVWVCGADFNEQRRIETMRVLEHAQGFIRRELASRVQLRHTPKLIFHWDFSPDHSARIDELINSWHTPLSSPTSGDPSNDTTV